MPETNQKGDHDQDPRDPNLRTCRVLTASLSMETLNPMPAGDEGAESPALKAIQGTWVSSENSSLEAKWVFKGDKLTASVNGMDYEGKVKIDDKAKPHPTLDIELTEGPEDAKGKTAKAVYKLEGQRIGRDVEHRSVRTAG